MPLDNFNSSTTTVNHTLLLTILRIPLMLLVLIVTESVSLGVYTLFMSRDQYKELREYETTEVFIPLFAELELLPLYFVVYYPEVTRYTKKYKCKVTKPGGEEINFTVNTKKQRLDFEYRHATRHVVHVMNPTLEDSGEYKFWCSGPTYYQPHQESFTTTAQKKMKLTFIKGNTFMARVIIPV